jgi:hypothetical protein
VTWAFAGAGDGNRTRIVSLGIGPIVSVCAADQETQLSRSGHESSVVALANCTLVARHQGSHLAGIDSLIVIARHRAGDGPRLVRAGFRLALGL